MISHYQNNLLNIEEMDLTNRSAKPLAVEVDCDNVMLTQNKCLLEHSITSMAYCPLSHLFFHPLLLHSAPDLLTVWPIVFISIEHCLLTLTPLPLVHLFTCCIFLLSLYLAKVNTLLSLQNKWFTWCIYTYSRNDIIETQRHRMLAELC